MPLSIRLRPFSQAAKALLPAGLSLFSPFLHAEDFPARRSLGALTPAATALPSPTPPPSVSPEELKAAMGVLRAEAVDESKKDSEQSEALKKELKELSLRLDELGKAQRQMDGRAALIEAAAVALKSDVGDARKSVTDGLKAVEEVHGQIESKGRRMEGLLDLANTLKRDLNDNSHEIAELKADLASLRAAVQKPTQESDSWTQFATWRYLPAVAVVLSAVALGVATSK
jgi:uncharacterized protein YoxC